MSTTNLKRQLLDLPRELLEIVIQYQFLISGQLHITCRSLWNIFVGWRKLLFRRKYGLDGFTLATRIKSIIEVRIILQNNPSWVILEKFFAYDWCFWQRRNIANTRNEDIRDVDDKMEAITGGVWKTLTGPMGGIHASNVQWLHLEYNTKLFANAHYRLVITLRVSNFVKLLPIRFKIVGEHVEQGWREFPPHTFHQLDRSNAYEDYLNFKAVDICLGSFYLSGQGLKDVKLEIEDTGVVMNRGILFKYALFEKIDKLDAGQWYLIKHKFKPSTDVKQAYEIFRSLKFQLEN